MSIRAWILGTALSATLPAALRAQSYQRIDTVLEIKQLFDADSRVFVGQRVHLHVSARTLARAKPVEHGVADRVLYRGLEIWLGRKLPSYRRFLRGKGAKGQACLKGAIRIVTDEKGKERKRLVVHTIRPDARPWSSPSEAAPQTDESCRTAEAWNHAGAQESAPPRAVSHVE